MKYRDLKLQTQREFPNNARTPGFGWLVRAGYMTREKQVLPIGEQTLGRLRELSDKPAFLKDLSLPTVGTENEVFYPIEGGDTAVIHCAACGYAARKELAQFKKVPFSQEQQLPVEKVLTPGCHTIEALAEFLNIPKEKTAKALMFTRISDGQFVFVVLRGDMTFSEAKLRNLIGEFRLAAPEEITKAGAAAGFASPMGLQNTLIIVDDLIPTSPNLVAGANEAEYHALNTNCGRDYTPGRVADLTLARPNDPCINCGHRLSELAALTLAARSEFHFENILLALAEAHHDDKGLTMPKSAAPFDVYLMHIPGKEMDTRAKAEEIYKTLQDVGTPVLFDDREERAGVKFNDADLVGCPLRVTVGEKNLKEGMVELKKRIEKENRLVSVADIVSAIQKVTNQS